ncbi:MAG TPA: FmdB family zinc ribbon protein [Acidimicrobiales bacterium]
MPTYEYRCKDCGKHLEVVQAFSDDPLTECPACAGTLKKVFQPIGIAFKGSGFYRNDSRAASGSSRSSKSAAPSSPSTNGSSDSSGGESSGGESSADSPSSSSAEAKTA